MAITIHEEDGSVRLVKAGHAAPTSSDATRRIRNATNCEALSTLRDALDASEGASAKYRREKMHDDHSTPPLRTPENAGDQQDL
jgi:hypothetical protein